MSKYRIIKNTILIYFFQRRKRHSQFNLLYCNDFILYILVYSFIRVFVVPCMHLFRNHIQTPVIKYHCFLYHIIIIVIVVVAVNTTNTNIYSKYVQYEQYILHTYIDRQAHFLQENSLLTLLCDGSTEQYIDSCLAV